MPPKPVPALKVKPNPSAKACRIVGCNYPPRTRGVCQEHYDQARHAGVRDEVCLPSSIKPAPKVAAVKTGEAVAKAPAANAEPLPQARITVLESALEVTAIRDALDVNKALPDEHPGHAIRRAIREAGAAGVAALEEASRLRAELTAIVTSSGVRIDGAEDLEPVEAVRRVIAELRRPEPATFAEIDRALDDLDIERHALLQRRTRLAEVEVARLRVVRAEEAARAAAAELEAARAEAARLSA